jgi:hypothetical protein
MAMSIIIEISRGEIWGSKDLAEIDVRASEIMLEEMVAMAIVAELGEDVEVSIEDIDATQISGADDEDLQAEVQEIEAEVRQSGDWLVYSADDGG